MQSEEMQLVNDQLATMQAELRKLRAEKELKDAAAKRHWKSAANALKNVESLREELENTKVISSNMLIRYASAHATRISLLFTCYFSTSSA